MAGERNLKFLLTQNGAEILQSPWKDTFSHCTSSSCSLDKSFPYSRDTCQRFASAISCNAVLLDHYSYSVVNVVPIAGSSVWQHSLAPKEKAIYCARQTHNAKNIISSRCVEADWGAVITCYQKHFLPLKKHNHDRPGTNCHQRWACKFLKVDGLSFPPATVKGNSCSVRTVKLRHHLSWTSTSSLRACPEVCCHGSIGRFKQVFLRFFLHFIRFVQNKAVQKTQAL